MAFESGLDVLMRQGAQVMGNTIKGIVAGIGERLSSLGSFLSSAEPEAAVEQNQGGFLTRMREAIFSQEPEIAPAEPVKLGRGARDAEIVASMQEQQGPNHASREEIGQLASQFNNVAQQRGVAGFSMNA